MLFVAEAAEGIDLKRVVVHRAVLEKTWKKRQIDADG
jgi:hypothetical protein